MPNLWPILIAFVLFFVGVPVAFSMIIASLIYFTFWCDGVTLFNMISALFEQSSSFTMMAVPFFILAGSVMGYGGVSESLMDFCGMLTSKFTGGLGATNCLLSTFMGGLSGSSCADAAFEARMLCPEMVKRGYPLGYSAALTATTSCITPIIPPGIALIIYATAASCSIGDMFLAGYIPGIIMCVALLAVNYFIAKTRGYQPAVKEKVTAKQFMKQLGSSIWALLMPVIILGGIFGGIFTPTESAAVAVVYALLVSLLIYKDIKIKDIPGIFVDGAISTATILLLVGISKSSGYVITTSGLPHQVLEVFSSFTNSTVVILLLLNILFLVIGMLMEANAAIIMMTPILLPLLDAFGIDPLQFGIMMSFNLCIGLVTPPVGICLLMTNQIAGARFVQTLKSVLPMLLIGIVVLMLVTYIPQVTTFLPGLIK